MKNSTPIPELFRSTADCRLPSASLLSTVSCLLVLLCFPVRAQDTAADNWSQFRGNQNLTGVSLGNVPNNLKPIGLTTPETRSNLLAAIVGGTVFVGSQKAN